MRMFKTPVDAHSTYEGNHINYEGDHVTHEDAPNEAVLTKNEHDNNSYFSALLLFMNGFSYTSPHLLKYWHVALIVRDWSVVTNSPGLRQDHLKDGQWLVG